MMKKPVRIAVALTVAVMLLLSAACGSAKPAAGEQKEQTTQEQAGTTTAATQEETEKEPVTISWLTSQAKFKEVQRKMAEQLKADEGITVDFQVVPDDQYYNLIKAKLATSEVPDVFEYNTPTTHEEIRATETCIPLDDQPWVSRLTNPGLLKDYKDGKIYALPREASSFFGACYYNKKVFDELGLTEPQTYEEFIALLEKIKTSGKNITPIYMSEKDSWTTQIFMTLGFSVALHPNDRDTYQKLLKNEVKWSDIPEMKEILTQYLELFKKGYANKDHLSATYDMAKEAVATGKAAMMLNGEWAASDIMAKWPDTQLGAFIIPFKDKQIMATGAYVQGLFIPKAGKNIENAKRFLDLWSQPKYQNMFYAELPGFPGLKDVDGGSVVPCVKTLVDKYVTTGQYTYQINDPMAFISPIFPELWKYYVEMTAGGKTPEKVLQDFDKKFSDYMKTKEQPGF